MKKIEIDKIKIARVVPLYSGVSLGGKRTGCK